MEFFVIPKYPTFRYDIDLPLWHLKKNVFQNCYLLSVICYL